MLGPSSGGSSGSQQAPPRAAFLRQLRGLEEHEAKDTWAALRLAIAEIHAKNASQLSFEELYRNAYNLVQFGFFKMLLAKSPVVQYENYFF